MPPYLPQFLVAAALTGLTRLVHFPLALGPGRSVDALDAFLLMFALVNLRLAWSGANLAGGGRAPGWFVALGLILAAVIATLMVQALTPVPSTPAA